MKYVYVGVGGLVCLGIVFFCIVTFRTPTAIAPVQSSVQNKALPTSPTTEQIMPITAVDPNKQSITIDPYAKVFAVKGVNYSFDVTEIKVKKGETVTINFESTDGFHDLVIDEFHAKTAQVRPGTPATVTFVANQVGTFEYYCSVGTHRMQGMVGKLIVED